jgi:outer membrane immunogenic protein
MRNTAIAVFISATMSLASSSYAADAYSTGSVKDGPVYSSTPNWTGFYVGGTIGAANTTATTTDADYFDYGGSFAQNELAFVYGLHAGYNWQRGMGVFGIEADINGSTFDKSVSSLECDGSCTRTFKSSWDWFSTLRGRLGLAAGNALVYTTAGVAFVDHKQSYTYTDTRDGGGVFSASHSGVSTGIAAGGGVEIAFDNHWSFRGEYLYIGLPAETKILHDPASSAVDNRFAMSSDAHIARVGMSYKLGGADYYIPLK